MALDQKLITISLEWWHSPTGPPSYSGGLLEPRSSRSVLANMDNSCHRKKMKKRRRRKKEEYSSGRLSATHIRQEPPALNRLVGL